MPVALSFPLDNVLPTPLVIVQDIDGDTVVGRAGSGRRQGVQPLRRQAAAAVIRQRIENPAYQLRTGGTTSDRLQQLRELSECDVRSTT